MRECVGTKDMLKLSLANLHALTFYIANIRLVFFFSTLFFLQSSPKRLAEFVLVIVVCGFCIQTNKTISKPIATNSNWKKSLLFYIGNHTINLYSLALGHQNGN